MTSEDLKELAGNPELMEIARKAVKDALVHMRDSRIFMIRGNGLVIREEDGSDSSIIRFGPETAMILGLNAIAEHLEKH